MAQNPTITLLDAAQVLKRLYDESNDSIRIQMGDSTSFAVELAASDGDNVAALGSTDGTMDGTLKVLKVDSTGAVVLAQTTASTSGSLSNASSAGTSIIAAASAVGLKDFYMYAITNTTITDSVLITLQVSPDDSADVWYSTTLTLTPSTTAAVVVAGAAVLSVVARRYRVVCAGPVTSGTATIYLNAFGRN